MEFKVRHGTNPNLIGSGGAISGDLIGLVGGLRGSGEREPQEEMRDLAAQGGAQIGLVEPSTDHDIRNAVAHKAQEHGIALKPKQVIVQRTVAGEKLKLHIAAQFHGAGELLAVLVESSFRLVERQKRELALPFFEWHLRARTLRPLVKTRGVRHDTAHG